MNPTHIVITTINDGAILLDIAANAAHYDRKATVWVIADKKTPADCYQNSHAAQKLGLDVRFLAPEKQGEAMKSFPEFYERLSWNSDCRRNIGYLLAYAEGCERLVILDDDNYPRENDFIGAHEIAGKRYNGPAQDARGGYYNYLGRAEYYTPIIPHPRGFPYFARGTQSYPSHASGKIGVNLGAWIGDPDVDAMTWIFAPFEVESWRNLPVTLSPGTWTPINSQNTCIVRELIPAAMFVPQRYPGIEFMDRFGDIFAGYFLQAVNENYLIHIGQPVVEHLRNSHNHTLDMIYETPAISMLEYLLPVLREFKSDASDIAERYRELAYYLINQGEKIPGIPQANAWLFETSWTMNAYAKACQTIEGKK